MKPVHYEQDPKEVYEKHPLKPGEPVEFVIYVRRAKNVGACMGIVVKPAEEPASAYSEKRLLQIAVENDSER